MHTIFYWLSNSRDYYKFQVEKGAAADQNFISELCVRYKINIVLCDEYLREATIRAMAINW